MEKADEQRKLRKININQLCNNYAEFNKDNAIAVIISMSFIIYNLYLYTYLYFNFNPHYDFNMPLGMMKEVYINIAKYLNYIVMGDLSLLSYFIPNIQINQDEIYLTLNMIIIIVLSIVTSIILHTLQILQYHKQIILNDLGIVEYYMPYWAIYANIKEEHQIYLKKLRGLDYRNIKTNKEILTLFNIDYDSFNEYDVVIINKRFMFFYSYIILTYVQKTVKNRNNKNERKKVQKIEEKEVEEEIILEQDDYNV